MPVEHWIIAGIAAFVIVLDWFVIARLKRILDQKSWIIECQDAYIRRIQHQNKVKRDADDTGN